ncbi:MAG: ribosome-associated protein [Verrucomicrobia bacterium]|nr:MAG: ribosome-associated protein [Verrucomicrobiota bacterium]
MQLPVKISYRGLEKSDQIDNLVLNYAARLEKFCDHINRCDVAIEQTNHTHQKGNPYRCRIDVTVARGHELVADERQMDNGTHQPLKKVIHAFAKIVATQARRLISKAPASGCVPCG